jgi:hypothetical protein
MKTSALDSFLGSEPETWFFWPFVFEIPRYTAMKDMPDISTFVSLFSVLKSSVELAERFDDREVKIEMIAKNQFLTEGDGIHGPAALTEFVITNRSKSPQSVTEITILIDDEKSIRIPSFETEFKTMNRDHLSTHAKRFQAEFDIGKGDLHHFEPLPSDIYLRQNESRSGPCTF